MSPRRILAVSVLALALLFAPRSARSEPVDWTLVNMESTASGAVTLQAIAFERTWFYTRHQFGLGTLHEGIFTPVTVDWADALGAVWQDHDQRLTLATTPAPAQRVTLWFEDGLEVQTVLPDTSDLRWGALFWIDVDSGDSYWMDLDHDGLLVEGQADIGDVLAPWAQDMLPEHLGASGSALPGPVEVPPPDDGRIQAELVQVADGAFEIDPPIHLGDREGQHLTHQALLAGQHNALLVRADGTWTHLPDHSGRTGRDGQLALRPADLSGADWVTAPCDADTVCVDPGLGRLRFPAGNDRATIEELGSAVTHWGSPDSACVNGAGLAALTQRESEASVILADVSDPAAITELAAVSAGWAYGCQFVGDRLYVVSKSGVTTIDVSDPAAPVVGAALSPTGQPSWGLTPATSGGVIIAEFGQLTRVEALDIDAPQALETWTLPTEWEDFQCGPLDDELCVVSDNEVLVVYSLTQPMVELARVPLELQATGAGITRVVRSGDILYASARSDALLVIDLPSAAVVQRIHDVDPATEDPGSGMDHLYSVELAADGTVWTAGDDGVKDDADPRRHFTTRYRSYAADADGLLTETGRYEAHGPYSIPRRLMPVDDQLLLVADVQYGLRAVQLGGSQWQHLSGIPSAGLTNDVARDSDGRFWAAEYLAGGLHVFELDDELQPQPVDYIHRGISAWGIGNDRAGRVYAGGRVEGEEWDGSTFNSGSGQIEVELFEDGAYRESIGGRAMYDVDDLGPFLASRDHVWHTSEDPPIKIEFGPGTYKSATLQDGRYLVAGPGCKGRDWWPDGSHPTLLVFDLAVPSVSTLIYAAPESADACHYGSTRSAGEFVLSSRGDRLDVWDFSDPRQPTLAVSLTEEELGQQVETVEVRGDHLYVHSWTGAEGVFDVSAGLTNPVLLDRVELPTFGYRSRLFADQLVQTSYWGLTWLEVPRSSAEPSEVAIRYFPVVEGDDDDSASTTDDDSASTDDDDSASTDDDDSGEIDPDPTDDGGPAVPTETSDCSCSTTRATGAWPLALVFLVGWWLARGSLPMPARHRPSRPPRGVDQTT